MKIEGWKYYIHAAIPDASPHETVDIAHIESGEIWKMDGKPLLARWTTDWECGMETNWWYVIKDSPFDISALKSKRRYEINKGNKNFEVKEIAPDAYAKEIYEVTVAAYETYPASYRPQISRDNFVQGIKKWQFYKTYGAFLIENGELCGYACLLRNGKYIDFHNLKAIPEKEKFGLNASIVNRILVDHEDFLSNGGYICDGSRSIQHETAFQDYLEKYFEFRKAYCNLHIAYKPTFKPIIDIAYCLRGMLKKLDGINAVKKINALLRMEVINRS